MDYQKEEILLSSKIEEYKKFLELHELTYEPTDYTLGLYDNGRLIGCCSLGGYCIKLLAIDEQYQGMGLTNTLVAEMIKRVYQQGHDNVFIFTKPEKEFEFNKLGFYTIVKTDKVLFLENNKNGISSYTNKLKSQSRPGNKIAAIVMNANPFTLGHKALVERASKENDVVHLFVVKEDKSVFPYNVRLKLIKDGVAEFTNVVVHEGSDYIISTATFPTYFIKSKDTIPDVYARLDALVFLEHIVPALGINVRYIGTEPFSKTTNMYNGVLKGEFAKKHITLVEMERIKLGDEVVSASRFREHIRNNEKEAAFRLLPKTTQDFLETDEGKQIIEKVKQMKANQRH